MCMSEQQLRIHLLGHFRLTLNSQTIEGLQADRYQSLLAYLVLCTQTPQRRGLVASIFWPETTDKKAKMNLRRELHRFRKILPDADQFVHVTNQTLQWYPQSPFWSDVGEFEAKLAQATEQLTSDKKIKSLQQAVELYQGDLLPTCYDDWILPERQRLHQLLLNALADLSRLLAATGDYRSAITSAQRLIQLDPLNELAYLTLMKCYGQQGDRANALQIYHQCMTLLREEMGIAPGIETRQCYEQLLIDETFPSTSQTINQSAPEPVPVVKAQTDWGDAPDTRFFYGRSQESEQLFQWITQDRCRLLTIFGVGGIGKTSLAAKVANELQSEFDFIVWRSLRNAPPLHGLLEDLVPFISNQQEENCSITRLVHWLRQARCLIILDNAETLFQEGEQAGRYREDYDNYGELMSVVGQTHHQSCLLITSREKTAEVATLSEVNPAVQALQLEGSPEAALAIIEAKHLTGSQVEKERLCDRYGHSPLSIQIISSSIQAVFDGEISLFLEENTLLFNGTKRLLDLQVERLSELETTVMTWLAINRDWTTITELKADIYPSCYKTKLMEALESLRWRSLIQRRGNAYTQQPVIMEYFTDRLVEKISEELADPNCFNRQPYTSLLAVTYALIKTTGKDFVRESQERLILQQVANLLQNSVNAPKECILRHFKVLQSLQTKSHGYSSGNLVNLAWAIDIPFQGLNLSGLTFYHAYLQHALLHEVNFAHSTFKEVAFNQPLDPICRIVYAPDGSMFATGEGGGRIIVWRSIDQRPILAIDEASTSWIMALDFIHGGKRLVSEGNAGEINVWDVATGQLVTVLKGHTGLVWTINTSPRGDLLVSASFDTFLIVWDLTTYELRHRLIGHTQQINSAVFSANGEKIASVSVDRTLRIWNTQTGELLTVWDCETEAHCGSFSPDGEYLATGHNDGKIKTWNLKTGKPSVVFQAHKYWIPSIAIRP